MVNVDQNEVSKFDQSAAEWWDPNGEFKPLHDLNPVRLQFIQSHIPLTGQRILDVGCGGGILSESMAHQGAYVTGIDLSQNAIQAARTHAQTQKLSIDYQTTSIEAFSDTTPDLFDAVTCMELLEHVPDPASLIQHCSNLVKAQGYVFFSTLNRTLKSFLGAIVGAEYILNLLPKGTHQYKRFIRPSELAEWTESEGLSLIEIKGMHYNPLTRRAQLTPRPHVNYLVACQKC